MNNHNKLGLERTSSSNKKEFSKIPQQHGVLIVNKPKGITSAKCISKIKHELGQKKIGHGGTLDPMAEGVLFVLLGEATKISNYLMVEGIKTYSGSILLGLTTDTWDVTGEVLNKQDPYNIEESSILDAMHKLSGTYSQEVPAYAAAKHNGKPLYELARKGLPTPKKSKEVSVHAKVEGIDLPYVYFRVDCSSGTYIRSLAHSLGMRLGCGASLASLTREYSYPFGLDKAYELDDILLNPEQFPDKVLPLTMALPKWQHVVIEDEIVQKVKNGNRLPMSLLKDKLTKPLIDNKVLLLSFDHKPVALGEVIKEDNRTVISILRGLWNT